MKVSKIVGLVLVAVMLAVLILGTSCGGGTSITGATLNSDGHLILILSDGKQLDAGVVVGPKGDIGATGAMGATGLQGPSGVGIQNILNNGDGTFTLNLTNGTIFTTANLTGPKGDTGPQGPQGPAFSGEWHNAIYVTSGIGSQTTGTFNITGNVFRIRWIASPTNDAISSGDGGFFSMFVYPNIQDPYYIGLTMEPKILMSSIGGVEYIISIPAEFYIQVYAANLDSWTIYVDSFY